MQKLSNQYHKNSVLVWNMKKSFPYKYNLGKKVVSMLQLLWVSFQVSSLLNLICLDVHLAANTIA